jgi:hypothetical protein
MSRNIRSRLISPCGTPNPDLDNIDLDSEALLGRILLFDRYILESWRLAEVPNLVREFGIDGTLDIFRSNAVNIHCDVMEVVESRPKGNPPYRHHILAPIYVAPRTELFHQAMQRIHRIEGVSQKNAIKLKEAVARILVDPLSEKVANEVQSQTNDDLANSNEEVQISAALALRLQTGTNVSPSDFSLTLHRTDVAKFESKSNISSLFGLDDEAAHGVIRTAMLAVARLNLRLGYMKNYESLSGLRVEEDLIMKHRLDFLADQIAPAAQERRLHRVVSIAGLPQLGAGSGLRIEKLLELRETKECSDFRTWLSGIDDVSDDEISARMASLREKIASATQGPSGKIVRLLVSAGVGLIPVVGPLAGLAAGLIDSFILERVLRESGPHAFLSHHYRSLFS